MNAIIKNQCLEDIANALRNRGFCSSKIKVADIAPMILNSQVGIDTSDATAQSDDIVDSKTAYVNGEKITGTNPYEKRITDQEVSEQADIIRQISEVITEKYAVPEVDQAVPEIAVSETGLITATSVQEYGVVQKGQQVATKQLAVCYISTAVPPNDVGLDGDFCIVKEV